MKLLIKVLFIAVLFIGCSSTQNYTVQQNIKQIKATNIVNIEPKNELILNEVKNSFTLPKRKITLLYSSNKLGKYAIDATNTAMAYLLTQSKPFDLQIIDMEDESWESMQKAIKDAQQKGVKTIVALITNASYEDLIDTDGMEQFDIFLPLVNKNNISKVRKNIIYGGVDYKKQFETLLSYSNRKDIEFYDNSLFGKILTNQLNQVDESLLFSKEVDDFSGSYAYYLNKKRKNLNGGTLFINTPIVKSSILLSQLRANDIKPNRILSTQINYTPLILSLTQAEDRKSLIIANSIRIIDTQLKENILNLDCDIVYDWLIYSTLVGVDYFYGDKNKIESNIVDNQVQYDIKLFKAKYHSFLEI